MKPKSQENSGQLDLFNTPLADLLNPKHELYQLANLIDWKVLDDVFGEFFTENQGAPALPTRLIAGLHYLKHAFARSDEAVVAQWLENPYWQYFCTPSEYKWRRVFPTPDALPPDVADLLAETGRRRRLRVDVIGDDPGGRR